jgi:hypothetical protein
MPERLDYSRAKSREPSEGRRLQRRAGVRRRQSGLRTAEQSPSAEADPTTE